MSIEDAKRELEELRLAENTATSTYKLRVKTLYEEVTGKHLRDCNCKDIYRDALAEIYNKLKTPTQRIMSNSKAKLVKGVVLQHEGNHYTNANLTDEVAKAFLAKYPMRVDWFEVLPEDKTEKVPVAEADKKPSDKMADVNAQLASTPKKKTAKKGK